MEYALPDSCRRRLLMRKTVLTRMPVSVLWEYREFKRDEVPAPVIPFLHDHSLDEITDYVRVHGIAPLELSVVKDRALLTDGNHRVVAAKRLGVKEVPVNVTVFFGDESADTFYEHTLERFKLMTDPLAIRLKFLFL